VDAGADGWLGGVWAVRTLADARRPIVARRQRRIMESLRIFRNHFRAGNNPKVNEPDVKCKPFVGGA
jgi:hypothetical protein